MSQGVGHLVFNFAQYQKLQRHLGLLGLKLAFIILVQSFGEFTSLTLEALYLAGKLLLAPPFLNLDNGKVVHVTNMVVGHVIISPDVGNVDGHLALVELAIFENVAVGVGCGMFVCQLRGRLLIFRLS